MNQRHLYTIKWTQTYATYQMRPYMRQLREEFEQMIEDRLEQKEFTEAQEVIKRIMSL